MEGQDTINAEQHPGFERPDSADREIRGESGLGIFLLRWHLLLIANDFHVQSKPLMELTK